MPIQNYICLNEKCENSDIVEERLVKFSNQDHQTCKKCGSDMELLFSPC